MTLNPLGGKIRHRGGILFLNLKNGKKIEVSRFTIDRDRADLTGIANGDPKVRVPLFRLDPVRTPSSRRASTSSPPAESA